MIAAPHTADAQGGSLPPHHVKVTQKPTQAIDP
jgi:hypothetical protein